MKEKFKDLVANNLAIIIFALSFLLDAQYGILERFIIDEFWRNIAKGVGAFVLAYFTRQNLGIAKFGIKGVSQETNKDEELPEDITGGGIRNPPKP